MFMKFNPTKQCNCSPSWYEGESHQLPMWARLDYNVSIKNLYINRHCHTNKRESRRVLAREPPSLLTRVHSMKHRSVTRNLIGVTEHQLW